jgi:hypothetical protein
VFKFDKFNPLETAIDDFHFSDIYFYWQRDSSNEAKGDIVIVNAAYLHDRDEIATMIDSINAHKPRVVAVDIIFPKTVNELASSDSHLVAAFNACSNIVLALRAVPVSKDDWNMERSFFADGHTEGVVNYSTSLVRTIDTAEVFGQKMFPTFAAQVVKQVGELPAEKERMIQFGGIDFMTWTPKEEFELDFLNNKIVIIGDTGDFRDWHDIPIGTTGRSRMSGVELHALSILTLLSPYHYRNFPVFWSKIIQIIIIYLFCFCLHKLWPKTTLDNWKQGLFQIAFIVVLMMVCYLLFRAFYLVCSPALAIVGLGLAGFAKNLTDFFTDEDRSKIIVEINSIK